MGSYSMKQHKLVVKIIEDNPNTFLLFLYCTDCLTILATECQSGNISRVLVGATTQ